MADARDRLAELMGLPNGSKLLVCAMDTETTGLNHGQHRNYRGPLDRIVEVGCEVHRGASFHSIVDPARPIPIQASRVHNIYAQQGMGRASTAGAKRWDVVKRQLSAFLAAECAKQGATHILVLTHNASFDLPFLHQTLELGGCASFTPTGVPAFSLCTLELSKRRKKMMEDTKHPYDHEPVSAKLAYVYKRITDNDLVGAHGALEDARACLRIGVDDFLITVTKRSDFRPLP